MSYFFSIGNIFRNIFRNIFLAPRILCLLCALLASRSAFSEEAGAVLSFHTVLESAVRNNFSLQTAALALKIAAGQLRIAKSDTDLSVGASAEWTRSHSPVDSADIRGSDAAARPVPDGDGGLRYEKSGMFCLEDTEADSIKGTVYARKLFTFGLQSKLSLEMARSCARQSGVYGDTWKAAFGDAALPESEARNNGTVRLDFTLPLFKSFSRSVAAKKIGAAEESYSQMQAEFEDTLCRTVLGASAAYWNFLTAHSKLRRLEELDARLETRVANAERLVSAGALSRNSLLALQIHRIQNARSIAQAEAAFSQSYMELASLIGAEPERNAVPSPEYNFDLIDFSRIALPDESAIDDAAVEGICARRGDIMALKKKVRAASLNLEAAVISASPDLNLNFGVGMTGTAYSDSPGAYFESLGKNVRGPDFYLGLAFAASAGADRAKGSREVYQGELERAEQELARRKQEVRTQLLVAAHSLNSFGKLARGAADVLKMQGTRYENEQMRFSAGLITADDMIERDGDYLAAQSDYYGVLIQYFQSLLSYKYYAGSLADVISSGESFVNTDVLYE